MEKVYTWKQLLRRYILGVCLKFLVFLFAVIALWILLHEGVYGAMMVLYGWLSGICALSALGLWYSLLYLVTLLKNKALSGNSQAVKALYTKKEKLILRIFTAVCAVIVAFVVYANAYFVFFYQNPSKKVVQERFALENYTEINPDVTVENTTMLEYKFFSVYFMDWHESYPCVAAEQDVTVESQENMDDLTNSISISVTYMENCPQWLIDQKYSDDTRYHETIVSWQEPTKQRKKEIDYLEFGDVTGYLRTTSKYTDGTPISYRIVLHNESRYLSVSVSGGDNSVNLDKLIEEAVAQMQSA